MVARSWEEGIVERNCSVGKGFSFGKMRMSWNQIKPLVVQQCGKERDTVAIKKDGHRPNQKNLRPNPGRNG